MKQETMPARENGTARRNKYFFGLGTIGRDMFYSMVSMFLLTYITEVLTVSDAMLLKIGFVLTVLRVFDALNDPIMGTLVDNTNTRWGKFKPLILGGAVTGAVFMVLLFTDLHLSDTWYIILFAVFYLAWDVFYGANDIAYWSMMPALSLDQKERERIGAHLRERGHVRGGGGHSARYGSDDGSDGKRYEGVVLFCGDRGALDAGLPVFYALWREGAPRHVQTGRKDHPERYHPRDL